MIFAGSTEFMSGERTSRFLTPLMRWLQPDLSIDSVRQVQFVIRKVTHVVEYFVFGLLAARAFWSNHVWARRGLVLAALTWAFCIGFAGLDEFHQSFVPSRESSARDVALDAGGALIGVSAVWLYGQRQKRGSAQSLPT